MKRKLFSLLFCLLLCACLPTPEKEYIVNKGDDTLQQIIAGAVEDTVVARSAESGSDVSKAAQVFPDRWTMERTSLTDYLTIEADAEIVSRADGRYPVFRTQPYPFTKDAIADMLARLLGKPVGEEEQIRTKAYWEEELRAYLERIEERERSETENPEADRDETGLSPEEIEKQTNWYMEQIRNAPDAAGSHRIESFDGLNMNARSVFTLDTGETVSVEAWQDWFCLCRNNDTEGYLLYEYDVDPHEQTGKLWHDVSMERRQAEEEAYALLDRLDFKGFRAASAYRANLLAVYQTRDVYLTNGWAFTLRRDYDGYPIPEGPVTTSSDLICGGGDDFAVNPRIRAEEIIIFADAEGVQYFSYSNPKTIVGIDNPDVELLPFETVEERVQRSMKYFNVERRQASNADCVIRVEIYRMMLAPYTVYVKNTRDYYEMPCWVVYYDVTREIPGVPAEEPEWIESRRNAYYKKHTCLIINAVDGSIIDTDRGY